MKTEQLIADLSGEPPRRQSPTASAMVIGATVVSLIVAVVASIFWLTPRSDLAAELLIENRAFLLKIAFTVGVIAGVLPIVRDLSVPGRRIGLESILVAAPFLAIIALGMQEVAHHHGSVRAPSHAWLECLWQIPALAVPAFVILGLAVRRLAPTNLPRVGAYIGLLAGGIGAVGYSLHCHHDSLAFVAAAYTAAIAEMTILGRVMGPRLLRWR